MAKQQRSGPSQALQHLAQRREHELPERDAGEEAGHGDRQPRQGRPVPPHFKRQPQTDQGPRDRVSQPAQMMPFGVRFDPAERAAQPDHVLREPRGRADGHDHQHPGNPHPHAVSAPVVVDAVATEPVNLHALAGGRSAPAGTRTMPPARRGVPGPRRTSRTAVTRAATGTGSRTPPAGR